MATNGHLVQGLFFFLESRLNLVRREASNLLRFGVGAGNGGIGRGSEGDLLISNGGGR